MRNKYDFENLVYEKANALSAKERRYAGYRKAVLSSAAVFAVLTAAAVGSFFSTSSEVDSMGYSVTAENDGVQNGAAAGKALNEDAAAQNDYRYSEDIYNNDFEEYDNYNNGLNAEDYDSFDDEFVENYDKTISENVGYIDRVSYAADNGKSVLGSNDENVFKDFRNAVENLEETKTLIDSSEKILCEINIIENSGHESDYVTRILVYGDELEITYDGEYSYNDYGQYVKVNDDESKTVGTYFISDEFIKLVRENFDEHFMDD